MGTCLGIIFALLIFVSTAVTLLFQWNVNATLKFERAEHKASVENTSEK